MGTRQGTKILQSINYASKVLFGRCNRAYLCLVAYPLSNSPIFDNPRFNISNFY